MALSHEQIENLAHAVSYDEPSMFYRTWFKFDDYGQPVFAITLHRESDAVELYMAQVNTARQFSAKRNDLGHWPNLLEYLEEFLTADVVFEIGRKEMVAFINHDESGDYHDWHESFGRSSFGATFEIGASF